MAGSEDYEVKYLAKKAGITVQKSGITVQQAKELRANHGNDRATLEPEAKALGKR